ncbi:hypothetical protein [Flavihumibacter sp. UBA7668]|uniref:hypothetical protein n=1 Tax=Flavihumibacter sp. UBA7668 TaxID=1946542 RepID=UPI0025BB2B0F|nr:hypothetical protein [Flavihumibacter sp. UBA7668]
MKNIFFLLFSCFFGQFALSQYYYNDLLANRQTNRQYSLFVQQGIKKVTITSYDGNSPESAGFTAEQTVDAGKRILRTKTLTSQQGDSQLEAYYNEKGWLIKTRDTAQNASNQSAYEYNANGQLIRLETSSRSDNITTTEVHLWEYNESGQPQSMLRIRNNSDTTRVSFSFDEKGNLVEEKSIRPNLPAIIYYYYYDTKNRLTDIVRYNAKAQRLLPDYIFEYNENDQLKKMTLVPEGSNAYEQWFYQYFPNGLRRMELVYNKEQQLMGKVEYQYN